MKTLLFVVGCTLFVSYGNGQTRWKFRSDNYVGIISGTLGGYGLVQTVNGFSRGAWFLGLGTGLDYYRYRTVPMFLSVTRDIPGVPKKSGLFLLLNGGINWPWYSRDKMLFDVASDRFAAGPWWNAGLGYRLKLSNNGSQALLLTAAYGVKRFSEHQKGLVCTLCFPVEYPPTYDYDYLSRVLMFSVGFQF